MSEWFGRFSVTRCGFFAHARGPCDRCTETARLYKVVLHDAYRTHLPGRYCLDHARELAQRHAAEETRERREVIKEVWR